MKAQTRRPVRLFVGILAVAVLAVLAVACGESSTSAGVVNAASVSVNPSAGGPSTTFTFTSVISTTAAADVTYQWERDTGELSAIESLTFTGASSQSVAHAWQPGGCSTQSRNRWVRLIVLSPNHLVSRQVSVPRVAATLPESLRKVPRLMRPDRPDTRAQEAQAAEAERPAGPALWTVAGYGSLPLDAVLAYACRPPLPERPGRRSGSGISRGHPLPITRS